jgi:hypothetical protein
MRPARSKRRDDGLQTRIRLFVDESGAVHREVSRNYGAGRFVSNRRIISTDYRLYARDNPGTKFDNLMPGSDITPPDAPKVTQSDVVDVVSALTDAQLEALGLQRTAVADPTVTDDPYALPRSFPHAGLLAELGVRSLGQLEELLEKENLVKVKGFGPVRSQEIRTAFEALKEDANALPF